MSQLRSGALKSSTQARLKLLFRTPALSDFTGDPRYEAPNAKRREAVPCSANLLAGSFQSTGVSLPDKQISTSPR